MILNSYLARSLLGLSKSRVTTGDGGTAKCTGQEKILCYEWGILGCLGISNPSPESVLPATVYAGWRRVALGELVERRLRQESAQDGEQTVLGPAMKAIEVKGDGIGDEGAFVIKTPSPY